MKNHLFQKIVSDMRREDAQASHLAVGALLVMTIIYAATMI
jgi:hypothetical protein